VTAILDATAADPEQIITELQRLLDERTVERDKYRAERDEALEQQTATAEVLRLRSRSGPSAATQAMYWHASDGERVAQAT
jgi:hypothetical protein